MKKMSKAILLFILGGFVVACSNPEMGGDSTETSIEESIQAPESTKVAEESTSAPEESATVAEDDENYRLRVGVLYKEQEELWEEIARRIESQYSNIELDVEEYRDMNELNYAFMDREINMIAAASLPEIYDYNYLFDLDLLPVANIYLSPMSLYLGQDSEDIEEGAIVGLASEPLSQGHSLDFLAQLNLIKLDENLDSDALPSLDDIVENPYQFKFVELPKVALVDRFKAGDFDILLTDLANAQHEGLDVNAPRNIEDPDRAKEIYYSTIAVDKDHVDSEALQAVIAEYQTHQTVQSTNALAPGAYIPVWSENENLVENYKTYAEKRTEAIQAWLNKDGEADESVSSDQADTDTSTSNQ